MDTLPTELVVEIVDYLNATDLTKFALAYPPVKYLWHYTKYKHYTGYNSKLNYCLEHKLIYKQELSEGDERFVPLYECLSRSLRAKNGRLFDYFWDILVNPPVNFRLSIDCSYSTYQSALLHDLLSNCKKSNQKKILDKIEQDTRLNLSILEWMNVLQVVLAKGEVVVRIMYKKKTEMIYIFFLVIGYRFYLPLLSYSDLARIYIERNQLKQLGSTKRKHEQMIYEEATTSTPNYSSIIMAVLIYVICKLI